MIIQKSFKLPPFRRGFHLITPEIIAQLPELNQIQAGILQVFIQHTSAGLTINENADPSVRIDFENFINDLIPEHYRKFIHTDEGKDDMPAHIKSSLFGCSVQVPISKGRLNLGIWQGIYLCEFRDRASSRSLILTALGN
jgi:secondary thiamine-phosphate synthase enzyme